jgi:hypothetical protein
MGQNQAEQTAQRSKQTEKVSQEKHSQNAKRTAEDIKIISERLLYPMKTGRFIYVVDSNATSTKSSASPISSTWINSVLVPAMKKTWSMCKCDVFVHQNDVHRYRKLSLYSQRKPFCGPSQDQKKLVTSIVHHQAMTGTSQTRCIVFDTPSCHIAIRDSSIHASKFFVKGMEQLIVFYRSFCIFPVIVSISDKSQEWENQAPAKEKNKLHKEDTKTDDIKNFENDACFIFLGRPSEESLTLIRTLLVSKTIQKRVKESLDTGHYYCVIALDPFYVFPDSIIAQHYNEHGKRESHHQSFQHRLAMILRPLTI